MPLDVAVSVILAVAVFGVLLWRRFRTRLRESDERRFGAILDSALDAVVTMDAAGRIVGWNGQASVIFGYPARVAIGRLLSETIIPERYREAHGKGLKHYLATGEGPVLNRRIEITALHSSGREFPVELSIAPIARLGAVQFSAFVRDIADRKRAEAELQDRQAYLDQLFEGSPEAIVIVDGENRVVRVNQEFTRLFGHSLVDSRGRDLDDMIAPKQLGEEATAFRNSVARGESVSAETLRRHRDGHSVEVSVLCFPVRVAGDQVAAYGIYRDISARRKLEDQLLHAHKMESIGRLAGGVAHDFNNIVTGIFGYLEAARADLAAGRSADADLAEVERAGRRAAELTRQLLGFARRQIAEPRIVDLNELTRALQSLLTRLIGEDIDLVLDLESALGPVRLDPSQFEQVLVNLAVNARDAMPTGGSLTITTRNRVPGGAAPPPDELLPGAWVELVTRDTGMGMDAATQQRAFEPFFTTKPLGAGTGLGLATCYGIIEQSGGRCTVDSEPGQGTAVHIYLPRSDAAVEPVPARERPSGPIRGAETILVVEDEESLGRIFRRVLQTKGYTVLLAGSGTEALGLVESYPGSIDLLLTDVVLPGMSGREVARSLVALRPDLRVLYMSGYTEDAIVRRGVLDRGIAFLSKPFTPDEVVRRVRDVLDAPH